MGHLGEIRMFGGYFAPLGWAFCQGQLLPISQYDAVFSVLGTTYGGDGQTTFALPDLRSRLPIGQGAGPGLTPRVLGQQMGTESVTLTPNQMPGHTHALRASSRPAGSAGAVGGVPAALPSDLAWSSAVASEPMAATSPAGSNQPHENRQPYLGVNYIICLEGIYPSQDSYMSESDDPFVGEIQMFGLNFAPRGWAWCHGTVIGIAQNTALFSLLGTTYGGNGQTTFALPDLRNRAALGFGQGPGLSPYVLGETGGSEKVSLIESEMPAHSHQLAASPGAATTANPATAVPATGEVPLYGPVTPGTEAVLEPTGLSQAHDNVQPSLTLNYCIALSGIFPPRS